MTREISEEKRLGQAAGLRPQTLRLLHDAAGTGAVTDFPLSLTREEALYLLELVETPWIVPSSWVEALETGLRYTRIAAERARRSGSPEFAVWLESHRIGPVTELLRRFRTDCASAPSSDSFPEIRNRD